MKCSPLVSFVALALTVASSQPSLAAPTSEVAPLAGVHQPSSTAASQVHAIAPDTASSADTATPESAWTWPWGSKKLNLAKNKNDNDVDVDTKQKTDVDVDLKNKNKFKKIKRTERDSSKMTLHVPTGSTVHDRMVYFPQIAAEASKSSDFRRVLWTGLHSQLVLMTVPPNGEIGEEIHKVDQTLSFVSGVARAIVNDEEKDVEAGDIVIVPAGCKHNFLNTGPNPLILYTIYAPAEHAADTVHKTKEEGDKAEEEGKDVPPPWARD